MSVETIACRFVGGPYDGTRFTTLPWPLPDFVALPLESPPGTYNKVSESNLKVNSKHLMRGVQYKWEAD